MVKISVIVPCHNDGQYLPRCLDSLTGQTLQDIEILVVENRSSDNSQAVIEEYAQKDSRIKALSISTESLSLARNKGLDKASGTYVMFCDPDGWFEPDMCRIMYYAIENSETDIADCGISCEFSADMTEQDRARRYSEDFSGPRRSGIHSLTRKHLLSTNPTVCSKIWRRDLIEHTALRFSPLRAHEDYDFWYRYAFRSQTICYIRNQLYHYFISQASINDSLASEDNPNRKSRLDVAMSFLDFVTVQQPKITDRTRKTVVAVFEEMAEQMSCLLKGNEQEEICRIINSTLRNRLQTETFFTPVAGTISNLNNGGSMTSLKVRRLLMNTRVLLNRINGREISDSLKYSIAVNDSRIQYRKNILSHK